MLVGREPGGELLRRRPCLRVGGWYSREGGLFLQGRKGNRRQAWESDITVAPRLKGYLKNVGY